MNFSANPARIAACLAVSLMIVVPLPLVAQTATNTGVAATTNDDDAFSNTVTRARNLYSTFDENAWRPVVKQQFMLEVARAFFTASRQSVPADLRHEVATLTTAEEFEKWLFEKWDDSGLNELDAEKAAKVPDAVSTFVLAQLAPGSRFVTARQNRVDKQLRENQYVGIGIRVRWDDDKAIIDDPFPGGAAHKAGSKPGDYIMEVDGRSMEGLNLGQIVDILRGLEGTKVTVVVQNKDGSEPRTLDMVRTVVPIPSLHGIRRLDDGSWQFFADKDPTHGYMNVSQVVGSTSAELKEGAQQVIDQGLDGVILDLRHVADGDLHHLNMIADVLCAEGKFGTLEMPGGQTRQLHSREHSDFDSLKVAVLTPRQKISGPMLALLTMLKHRPHTRLFGAESISDLACVGSFDLPDNDGAISNLAYARFVPDLKHVAKESQMSHEQVVEMAGQIQFAPHKEEADDKKVLKLAVDWLETYDGS